MKESLSPKLLRLGKRLLAPLIIIAASFSFVAVNAASHERMSPLDEYVYIDYLVKIPSQLMVRHGEPTGETARELYSCTGVEVFGKAAPENCSTGKYTADSDYPANGTNTADIYTPLYFAATWLFAQPIMWVSGVDLVQAGRIAGGVWLAAAGILLYLSLGRLRISPAMRLAAPLLMLSSISAWWANTYVSTDATALFAGSAMLLLVLRYSQTGRGGISIALVSVLSIALKFQNYIAVVFAAIFLTFIYFSRQRRSRSRPANVDATIPQPSFWVILCMLLLPVLFQLGWMTLRTRLSMAPPLPSDYSSALGLPELVREMLKFFSRISNSQAVNPEATMGWALSTFTSWLLIAGVIAAITINARWSTRYALGLGWILTALTAGPALAVATYLMEGYYFELPTRYGLSLLPGAVVLAACLFDGKKETRVGFSILAGGTLLLSLTPYYPGAEMFG